MMRSYDRAYHLSFAVTVAAGSFGPERINPALKSFRRKLMELVLDAPPLHATVNDLDNFFCEEKLARILGRYNIVFHVVDGEERGAADRFNAGTDSALDALLKNVKVEMDGVKIGVLDVVRPSDCKDSRLWPREKW